MIMNSRERRLCQVLRDLPVKFDYRYTPEASRALKQALFRSLVGNNDGYLRNLFQGNLPKSHQEWSLRKAQGMVEGAEYTEAARGKACGHIFKTGEATYRCRTCTLDDTCVLCSRCYQSSDHEGHPVTVSIASGNCGCCDCGDVEAWKIPVNCAIHAANNSSNAAGKKRQQADLPEDLVESVRMTIARVIDYMCDVISCSPEQLRLSKSEETIRQDERLSHLSSKYYEDIEDPKPEFALILWNDEKHTIDEVAQQVTRACKNQLEFGLAKANEINDVGRSVIEHSHDVPRLLKISKIIEAIKITVTIRSSRDTFREQMCGTMIEWLLDIAGGSVGEEHDILRLTICTEMLRPWRTGSAAANSSIGQGGLDDHGIDDSTELNEYFVAQVTHRDDIAGRLTTVDTGSDPDVDRNDDGDDEADSLLNDDDDEMELDVDMVGAAETDRDHEMRTPGELEDDTEVSEATYAGYPPPPPPPPPGAPRLASAPVPASNFSDSDSFEARITSRTASKARIAVPKTPWNQQRKLFDNPPGHWLERSEGYASGDLVELQEDLRQRLRLDWMIMFDLRLWKKARVDLRGLYISTVVTLPYFKRILALRFAGLYTVLAQLYLIADREPDHSIINLSLQMLTTPSITEEIVERGNFLTNLIAILYTFLTSRQVGHPWEIQPKATLAYDAGSVTNRRMYHFFTDLKYLLGSGYVQRKLRTEERYLLQFLDLVRLPQGICPNVRAVGDHVEYETDAWIGASLLTKEINKLCRHFAESFRWENEEEQLNLSRVIRTVARATVINAIGAERARFIHAEIRDETKFKKLPPFEFDTNEHGYETKYSVVDFVVEKEHISFHHALHYTLSWLIACGKSMSRDELRTLLHFTVKELRETAQDKTLVPVHDAESYLMALFDFPLRVCAWLAQMKAGMWVRNGLSLRHQMGTYRSVSHRDLAHHRDIFLLQIAICICNPSRVLASMIERFGMSDWMRGNYIVRAGYEPGQLLDVAEDFIHLMIVLLSDRASLQPFEDEASPQSLAIRRDIAHILCFKPLSFSDLSSRLADKFQDLEEFQQILEEITTFRAPEGLSDSGTFELKQEYLANVDPYIAHYNKNQRDEAENAYRTWTAKRTGKPIAEVILEPKLQQIKSGVFTNLSSITRTPLFAQIIYYSLMFPLMFPLKTPGVLEIPVTRVEAFLQVVLHLMLIAIHEDQSDEGDDPPEEGISYVHYSICTHPGGRGSESSTLTALLGLLGCDDIKGSHPKIRLIMHRFQQRRPHAFLSEMSQLTSHGAAQSISHNILGFESPRTPLADDQDVKQKQALELQEEKKKQALARQAKVMAQFQQQQQKFLDNQDSLDWVEEDFDDLDSVATGETEEHKKVWKYPTGNCILCQEETNDTRLYGTFALVMGSTILRQTNLHNSDFINEVLSTPAHLDRSAEGIRPFGIAGQNRRDIPKLTADGYKIMSEHQDLGKGFPSKHHLKGPVSTGCGHIMHYTCFELYCGATQRRQHNQIARNHPEFLARKEFVCPLCKALGNTFLPIIWKGKEELYPGPLQTELSYTEWLESGIGLTVSRFWKCAVMEGAKSNGSRYQDLFVNYTSSTLIPPLASKFELMQSPLASPISLLQNNRNPTLESHRMPWAFSGMEGGHNVQSYHLQEPHLMNELIAIYDRIRESIRVNGLPSRFNYPLKVPEDLIHTDTLARTLGFSIAATEIAQRGVQSEPGLNLLDKIPSLALAHLRILSETASSYIAIGGMRHSGTNSAAQEFSDTNNHQLLQLFAGHPHISGEWGKEHVASALTQDAFIFLAECSVCLVPAFNLDIHHIVHLCYLLELTRAVLNLISSDIPLWANAAAEHDNSDVNPENLHAFNKFMWRIRCFRDPQLPATPRHYPPATARTFYKAICTYALPFLRKTAILLNVRYGIDFPNVGFADIDEPELARLSKALRLPSLPDIFAAVGGDLSGNHLSVEQMMVAGWIEQCNDTSRAHIRLSHPAIFELIGLPKYYDTLTQESMKRRCPTTGKDLTDPALCLFCGEIFCSQATCCHDKEGKGGCNQHLSKCGGEVGLFLNIRKCTILFLHRRNGSWTHAPFLDKHGEVDPGLRRNRQLILSQKRYDALLRNSWLQHGIPTMISRKLEADMNNGGWETL